MRVVDTGAIAVAVVWAYVHSHACIETYLCSVSKALCNIYARACTPTYMTRHVSCLSLKSDVQFRIQPTRHPGAGGCCCCSNKQCYPLELSYFALRILLALVAYFALCVLDTCRFSTSRSDCDWCVDDPGSIDIGMTDFNPPWAEWQTFCSSHLSLWYSLTVRWILVAAAVSTETLKWLGP
jgi:hypothetical protein